VKNSSLELLRLFMWLACVFHIGVGLALNLDIGLKEWVAASLYGARVDWNDPQFVYILRPLGAFMIALGIMAAIAARNPLANRSIVHGFAVLWVLRGLQRIVFLDEVQRAFAIPAAKSVGTMVLMVTLALALVVLARSAASGAASRPGPPTA
jgi:hypothetical protein